MIATKNAVVGIKVNTHPDRLRCGILAYIAVLQKLKFDRDAVDREV